MKIKTIKAIRESRVMIANRYKTERGAYRESILLHKSGDLYFCKSKDGELVNLVNLTEKAERMQREQ